VSAEYFETLFKYNAWANERVLERAAHVAAEDYFADAAGLSFGSLHGTLAHIASGEATWLRRWDRDLALDSLPDGEPPTDFETVRVQLCSIDAALRTFVGGLADEDLDGPITYLGPSGIEYTDPLSLQLFHVVNHGTQFRAEAAVRLSQLGLSPENIDLTVVLRRLT
jgi:uncharacterized damage-inducible protein DinB